jgi:large subunit ribosomal protein L10
MLEGPTALALVGGDAAMAAKALNDTARALNNLIEFKGGLLDGNVLSADDVRAIARLPSRDVLNAQLVGTIAAPLVGLVRTLNALIAGLAIQLQAIADQGLVSGEAPAAAAEPEAAAEPAAEAEPAAAAEPEAAAEPAAEAELEAAAEPAVEAPAEAEPAAEPEAAAEPAPEPEAEAAAEPEAEAAAEAAPEPEAAAEPEQPSEETEQPEADAADADASDA